MPEGENFLTKLLPPAACFINRERKTHRLQAVGSLFREILPEPHLGRDRLGPEEIEFFSVVGVVI